ncbi:MAG: arginine deiminase-related protein [Chthoniobacterales bacterium]
MEPAAAVAPRALAEFDEAVRQLRDAGITVHVFEGAPASVKPDAVFPNNWFSTHHDGRIALYPMYTPSRRPDIIESLRESYHVTEVIDYSPYNEKSHAWFV